MDGRISQVAVPLPVGGEGAFLASMTARLGNAFILLGVITLAVFWLTLTISQENLWVFVLGGGLSLVGLMLRRRGLAGSKPPAPRFQTLKRLLGGKKPEDHKG